jgi:hypothetical protein
MKVMSISSKLNKYFLRIFGKILIMETIRVDILNPKAKSILRNLADLNLIRIKSTRVKSELKDLLNRLRENKDETPTLEEITSEVELVRKSRYEK